MLSVVRMASRLFFLQLVFILRGSPYLPAIVSELGVEGRLKVSARPRVEAFLLLLSPNPTMQSIGLPVRSARELSPASGSMLDVYRRGFATEVQVGRTSSTANVARRRTHCNLLILVTDDSLEPR